MLGHLEVFSLECFEILLTVLFDKRKLVNDLLVELKVGLLDQMVFDSWLEWVIIRFSVTDLVESSVSEDLFDFLNETITFENHLVDRC